jgi:hypothetical protein
MQLYLRSTIHMHSSFYVLIVLVSKCGPNFAIITAPHERLSGPALDRNISRWLMWDNEYNCVSRVSSRYRTVSTQFLGFIKVCLCYRTNLTNVEFIMKDLEARWFQLPEEVRALYGQNYLDKYQVNIKLANDSCVFVYSFWNNPIQKD